MRTRPHAGACLDSHTPGVSTSRPQQPAMRAGEGGSLGSSTPPRHVPVPLECGRQGRQHGPLRREPEGLIRVSRPVCGFRIEVR